MELTREVLRSRYNTFSDQALLAASAAGPMPYSPLAWEVIQALLQARRLADRAPTNGSAAPAAASAPTPKPFPAAKAPPTAPTAPTPKAFPAAKAPPTTPSPTPKPVEAAPSTAVSPYLLVSRLGRLRWSADDPLPTLARDIMGVAALMYGVFGLALVIAAFIIRGLAAARGPGVLELGAFSALSLAFGFTTRCPPSPRWWWLATLYCGVSPALALSRIGSATGSRWPQLALGAFVGAIWFVYFARRRWTYGLAPWRRLG